MSQRRRCPRSCSAPAGTAAAATAVAAHASCCLPRLQQPLGPRSQTGATEIQPGPRSLRLPPVRPAPQGAWAALCWLPVQGWRPL